MNVLVDTPMWSLALRRSAGNLSAERESLRRELAELVREGRVQLIGPILQELLSGVKDVAQFRKLRAALRAFNDEPLDRDDYEQAARVSNDCRAAGLASSATDALICAVALRRHWPIFTQDRDFQRYAEVVPIHLHQARSGREPV